MRRATLCLTLLALLAAPAAADQIFLKLEGIKGDAQDFVHKDEIAVVSYSIGGAAALNFGTSGGGAPSKAQLSELNITHLLDSASPLLYQRLFNGKAIPTLQLTARGPQPNSEEGFEYFKINCNNAWVTGISTEGDIEGRPVEKVQFKCRTFAISQYTLSVPAQPGKNRCFCWDLAVYGKCTTATCPPGATPL